MTLTIDINIPFYLYNCNVRTKITYLILKHYENTVDILEKKYDVLFSFTFIGSEEKISEEFIKNNFNKNYTYYEFVQSTFNHGYNKDFLNMLTDKFRFSYKKSIEKKPNITLLAGSNDFLSIRFFEQVINYYNSNKIQLYGISNKNNGENVSVFSTLLDENNFHKKLYYHTGIFNHFYIERNTKYIGGTIGFDDKLYNNYYNELMNDIICFNECIIEKKISNLPNIDIFLSSKCYMVNIKTKTNKEITTLNSLLSEKPEQVKQKEQVDKDVIKLIETEYLEFIKKYNLYNY